MAALLAWMPGVRAQVSAELVLDQELFLSQESLFVGVKVTNLSGKALEFGTNAEWLRFSVEYVGGAAVNQIVELPRQEAFILENSKRGTRVVDLAECYDCAKPGRYTVTAIINIPGWDSVIMSPAKSFTVINGTRIWEQIFGVPVANASSNQVSSRKYILQKMVTMKENRLYIRLTDAEEGKTYRVYQLCPMVSFAQPETQIDKDSNLNVLCQTGARIFTFLVVSPNCELVKRISYEYAGSRPTMSVDGEGGFRIAGGKRRVTPDDIGTTSELPIAKIVTPIDTNSVPEKKKKKKKDDW
jgi:hypothetical protein